MDLRVKKNNFFGLTYLFFLFVFFVCLFLNINKYKQTIESNSILQVELKNNIAKEDIDAIEKKLWGIKEVKNLRYYSSERGLEKLVKELQISIPKANNPLSNLIIVNVLGVDNQKKLIETLSENEKNIVSFHYDEEINSKISQTILNLQILLFSIGLLALLPISYKIFLTFNSLVYEKYIYYYFLLKNKEQALGRSKRAVFLPLIASSMLGSSLYFNLYLLFKSNFSEGISVAFKINEIEMAVSASSLVLCIVLFLIFIPLEFNDKSGK